MMTIFLCGYNLKKSLGNEINIKSYEDVWLDSSNLKEPFLRLRNISEDKNSFFFWSG